MRRPKYKVGDFVVSTYPSNKTLMYVVSMLDIKDRWDTHQDKHLVFCNVLDKNPTSSHLKQLTFDARYEWWEVRRATTMEIIQMEKLSEDGSV